MHAIKIHNAGRSIGEGACVDLMQTGFKKAMDKNSSIVIVASPDAALYAVCVTSLPDTLGRVLKGQSLRSVTLHTADGVLFASCTADPLDLVNLPEITEQDIAGVLRAKWHMVEVADMLRAVAESEDREVHAAETMAARILTSMEPDELHELRKDAQARGRVAAIGSYLINNGTLVL
ncbi:hypothetical protein BcepSauron_041 [Burkholderia phage BcepSauron]|uniref:Uncharacterized protein n=1 Tax=Burkholderia phage BcepSauron TaxID=2530033 RepID=A0A482MK58_9CAUD|nr:hypothetical protein H1O17_gp041 [Burkholderia phage BcepSauron]QBQ74421.1 hypothetical protein BcepSauron_041 [Burkholderia phage BcepSauron]